MKCSDSLKFCNNFNIKVIYFCIPVFWITGCNEISDSGLWTGNVPKLETLIILDCINIADETIAAICQMLPVLRKLQIQVIFFWKMIY
jgi:hypothetical protein